MSSRSINLARGIAFIWLILCAALTALADRQLGTIGPPQRQNPQRQTSGEATAPLPLPATPMRRSEPKAEPAPPLFIGKLKYGTTQDYMPNPGDVDNLLRHVRYQLDAWYGWQPIGIDEIVAMYKKGKRCELPLLYITGYESFEFTAEQREALVDYIQEGGTLLGDAALGSPAFTKSFEAEVLRMFPQRKLEILQLDHPILHGYYNYQNVHYFTIAQGIHTRIEGPPALLGMNFNARTAVILSPYDMTCGWDEFYAPPAPRAGNAKPEPTMAMMPNDALRMGINIVSYTAAQRRFAKAQAVTREVVGDQPQKRAAVPIALLKHQGDWNPDPNSLQQLIRLLAQQTSVPMEFKLQPVDAKVEELIDTPILVMTGMDEPKLTDDEVAALRRHLQAGGFLFINNTSGFAKFDKEARATIARIFPNQKLEPVPADHELFKSLYEVKSARDAGTLAQRDAELEMVSLDGRAAIVYSKNDTLAMLKGVHDPYANAYDAESARKIALNILTYAARR
ncbi:MAG: DUF4159 domain-containing protein [Phycisphaeraceae bacterium]|nr:DUF4159 domain-containing protein [Phycisphaeraceae bacterium]